VASEGEHLLEIAHKNNIDLEGSHLAAYPDINSRRMRSVVGVLDLSCYCGTTARF
jgi:hypothetical protein